MNSLERKQIKFMNAVAFDQVFKIGLSKIDDPDIDHVTGFRDPSVIDEHVANIDLALSNRFSEIADNGFCNERGIAFIEVDRIDFYDEDGNEIIGTGSLSDYKELLIAWRKFLAEPPPDGSFIKTKWWTRMMNKLKKS